MLDFLIRKMYEPDVETVYNIIKTNKDVFSNFKDLKYWGWSREQIRKWVKSDNILLVAETEGEIAGFITSRYHRPTDEILLENIYVLEKYRRRGIGTALIEEFKRRAKGMGKKRESMCFPM